MIFCSGSQAKMLFSFKPSDAGQTEPLPESGDCTSVLETSETSTVLHGDREGGLPFPSHSLKEICNSQCAWNSFIRLHLLHKIPQLPFRTFSNRPHCPKTLLSLWLTPQMFMLGSLIHQPLTVFS